MKITLIVVGKTSFDYLKEGIDIYQKRLKHYCRFSLEIIPDIKNPKNLSEAQIKQKEGESILKKIKNPDHLILLDDKGKEYTSIQLSKQMESRWQTSGRDLVFLVGGAYGFSKEVYQRANEKMSLSKMTFSHQMVRLFFIEQLYRCFTILGNEPYHHE